MPQYAPRHSRTLVEFRRSLISVARQTLGALLSIGFLASCAGQRAPDGGPIDTEPPYLASTIPPNYTTRFHGNSITLEFNKYVDHRTVEGAVFISPSLGQLQFDWSGHEVEIRFPGTLRRSTTYVVTIGTDVADLNNHNKMAQSYTLAFTTGEDIDHGAIAGKIFTQKESDSPLGVMIFAYKLDGLRPDTLDPRTTKPDYVTQSGKDGGFLLQHLTFGSYRVIAVRDEFKNLLYDPETDEFGTQPDEIVLTPRDTLKAGVWMILGKEDTTAIRMTKAAATNARHVTIDFSSPIDTMGLSPGWFSIRDTLNGKHVTVLSACPMFPKLTSVVLVTDTQHAGLGYRVEIASLRGINGLLINPSADRLTFTASESRDTLGPRIASLSISDSAREIDLQPKFLLTFSDAVKRESAEKSITLADSSRSTIPLSLHWLSDASVELSLGGKLASKAWFSVRFGMRTVVDLSGRRGRDSLRVFRFQTVDDEVFSSIEGFVNDVSVTDLVGDFFLKARNVSRKEPKEFMVRLPRTGPFVMNDLPEGKYILQAFRDRDGDKKFSLGRVFPFRQSERFTQFPDTLRLRARWPLEGVELKLQ